MDAFFHLPYPLFLFQFKGYYGDAVSYPLHLMKFNSKFNGESGNFEIKCEFIGHTFAFLSDMLLGYAKAAPYMKEGGGDIVNCDTCPDGKAVPIETIKEYLEKLKAVVADVDIIEQSEDRENYDHLQQWKTNELPDIEKKINEIKEDWNTKKTTAYLITNGGHKSDFLNYIYKKFIKDTATATATYNDIIDGYISNNSTAVFKEIIAQLKIMKVFVKGSDATYGSTTEPTMIGQAGTPIKYWSLADAFKNHLYPGYKDLEDIVNNKLISLSNKLTVRTENVATSNDFDGHIKYVVDILNCGFEIFLSRLFESSRQADDAYNIKPPTPLAQALRKNDEDHKADRKNDKIYPWPLYYQNGVKNILDVKIVQPY